MSKLDELLFGAKQVASIATRKTGEAVEVSKLKMQASQVNAMMQSTYERIGNLVYEQEKTGTDNSDLIAVCIKEQDGLIVELNEINTKISDIKRGVTCHRCSAVNPYESTYCSKCGANLKKPKTQPQKGDGTSNPEDSTEE